MSTFEWLLYLIVISILWNLTALATAEARAFFGFDVDKDSSVIRMIDAMIAGFGGCYLIDFVRKKWTGS